MSKKERYAISPNSSVNFLKRQITLEGFDVEQLSSVLGPPADGHGEKIRREWIVCGPNGCVILIYDRAGDDHSAKKWQVEAVVPEHAKDFLKWLKEKF